ncbi:MAG: hypothetical protein FWC96_00555 [Oscillospiraceae bacterium]|nr:hypothetical protein [Oscillospiraceae bacterium]
MVSKIYITGPVGGGKSTLARKISKEFGITYFEMDSVIYEPDPDSKITGTRKRPESERDFLINEVLSSESWVAEDAGREIFEILWQEADSIILLEPPVHTRKCRIILRWIKQMLRVEKCGYRPGLYMLKLMFKWTKGYEHGTLKDRLPPYKYKISVLQTEQDIERYISKNFAIQTAPSARQ